MTVIESAKNQVKTRREWLDEAYEAQTLVETLPPEISSLEGGLDINGEVATLSLTGGDDAVTVCKEAGVVFEKPKMAGYSSDFKVIGHLNIFAIIIYNLEVPANCRVEEYKDTITRYRAICEETELEVTESGIC